MWSIVAMVAAVSLGLGASRARAQEHDAQSPYENLRTLARVLAHVEQSYVQRIDQEAVVEGAIRGMLASLDPHSAFLDRHEYAQLTSDTEGRFAGIGVEINVLDGWLTVVGVFPGGPAARAGLKVGDRFLTIEGQTARDMRLDEAVRRMRGAPGTLVHVSVRRDPEGPAREFELRRAIIDVDAVEARMLPGRVLQLTVRAFQETTLRELRAALDAAVEQLGSEEALRGVLLDLRDNPGGLVDQAVAVADEFLREGVIVSTRGRDGKLLSEHRARRLRTRPGWPLVVLINGFTASAAEIVAAALRDNERAIVVGEGSFGKGSVQNIIELPDGSALKLTVARYYTPAGTSLQARGIQPDIRVSPLALQARDAAGLREADLAGHLRADEASPSVDGVPRDRPRSAAASPPGRPFADDAQASVAYETLLALIGERERAQAP